MAHHDHASHPHHHPEAAPKAGLHKSWKVWVVLGLMLLGMLIYILTLDESLP